jgi:hypothetical protein
MRERERERDNERSYLFAFLKPNHFASYELLTGR